MQNYKYTAINLQKRKFTGIFMAEDETDLAAQLARQNLFLVKCKPYSSKTPSAFWTMGTGKVNINELTTFCRQFSIMLSSGISVIESLESLKSQAYSAFFKNLLEVIYEDVKSGIMLSEALEKHKAVFPDFFRSMIYVGESSGNMEMVLDSLADYYEKDTAIRKKTKSAFAYPSFLACLTIGIIVLMLALIIPTFKDTFADLGVAPSGLAAVVFKLSDFLMANWLYILSGIILIAIIIWAVKKTEKGAYFFDVCKIKLPLFKKVNIALITSRFARSFSLLLASGMDMIEALDDVSIVITNRDVRKRFLLAVEDIKHGMPMSTAFESYNIFPPLMLQMINVGEKTAEMDDVLSRSCNFFDREAEDTLQKVTAVIQPVMLLIMGVVIGTLFLAVYSPIISIMQSF